MKFKTFIFTLILFLIFFYGGIFFILSGSLRGSLSNIKERALGEQHFITTSYYNDLISIKNRAEDVDEYAKSLFDSYTYYYQKQPVRIAVYKDDSLVKSMLPEGKYSINMECEEEKRKVFYDSVNEDRYLFVVGSLPEPFESYKIVYAYDLTDVLNEWDNMVRGYFGAGVIISVILGIILYFVLQLLFKPLTEIALVSEKMAEGEYENRININGGEELNQVAVSFNNMADKIESHIEQLAESVKEKQHFIDNLAHEIRTPLTSIYGYAEYIQRAQLTDEDKYDATSFIMSQSHRLLEMSDKLLNLALYREKSISFQNIDISEVLNNVESMLKNKIEKKNINLIMNIESNIIKGDRCLLESLFINIIENAVKACSNEGEIRIKSYLDDSKKVIAEIEDNGKGIPESAIKHIEEAFYRVDKARDRAEGGAGIGLSLCRQIIDKHNGEMKFMSEEGAGTKVIISFTTS